MSLISYIIELHKCVFCPMTFKCSYRLKRHILNVYPPLESKVQCAKCPMEFKNEQYLKEHMEVHTAKVKCDLCDKIFHSNLCLRRHKNNMHPNKSRLRCDKCDKEFANARSLSCHKESDHVEVDESNYEHKCEECGKKFKIRKYLNSHLQRHEHQRMQRNFLMRKQANSVTGHADERPGKKSSKCKEPPSGIEF